MPTPRNPLAPSARRVQPPLNVPTARHSRSWATGQALDLGPRGSVGNTGRAEFWAQLVGPGPNYAFGEFDGTPLAAKTGGRVGVAVEVNGQLDLDGKLARVYMAEDGDYATAFNRVVPPETCDVCAIIVDYDTGAPVVGISVWFAGAYRITDGDGKVCASVPENPEYPVGGSILQNPDYLDEAICVPCGETRTVTVYARDKWVYIGSCCTLVDPCSTYTGRKPGIFPRDLYGVFGGPEWLVGGGAAVAMRFTPGITNPVQWSGGWDYRWVSEPVVTGAYGSCPACAYRPIYPDGNYPGWCGIPKREGLGCTDPYTMGGFPFLKIVPPLVFKDQKVYYGSTRLVFTLRIWGGPMRGNQSNPVTRCQGFLSIENYWNATGTLPDPRPECNPCTPGGGPSLAAPTWPVCLQECPCGEDPLTVDTYWKVAKWQDSQRGTVFTELSITDFCGPVDLELTGELNNANCTPLSVSPLTGVVVEDV